MTLLHPDIPPQVNIISITRPSSQTIYSGTPVEVGLRDENNYVSYKTFKTLAEAEDFYNQLQIGEAVPDGVSYLEDNDGRVMTYNGMEFLNYVVFIEEDSSSLMVAKTCLGDITQHYTN